MASTSSRTLRLLSLLQNHRFWIGTELADRLDVSLRTLRRDIDRLRDLGYPVRSDRGVGGGYQLAPGASLPPLVLDDDEAVALAVGLLSSAHTSITDIAETSVRALAKVIQVMPQRLRRRVEALRAVTVSADTPWAAQGTDSEQLVTVAQACRDDERVTFDYTAADGERTSRRVEPHQLVSLGRRWYLVGYDLDRCDWRSFRFDRMTRVDSTRDRFRRRDLPGGDAAEFVEAGIRGRHAVKVVAELAAPAERVRRAVGRWVEVTGVEADRCRVEIDADSMDWAVIAVGMSGEPVISASPPEYADRLRDWANRLEV
ncbi:helix-turn-helix transcriptional regulator [Nesterenkonia ebinurensis]|uniref:helix-turn-helix transcriptional regulator n=1 Tax=Nesterenkonia ebinurensis TaxID=2608252 RepID=UPI00123D86D4|nr:YafY family protein [Nesterenkonia ebinurensis]